MGSLDHKTFLEAVGTDTESKTHPNSTRQSVNTSLGKHTSGGNPVTKAMCVRPLKDIRSSIYFRTENTSTIKMIINS